MQLGGPQLKESTIIEMQLNDPSAWDNDGSISESRQWAAITNDSVTEEASRVNRLGTPEQLGQAFPAQPHG